MIVSAIDGRIRFVAPSLVGSLKADIVEKRLRGIKGITGARVNPQTGSLLVHYDRSLVSGRTVRHLVPRQAGLKRNAGPLTGLAARRYVKLGMLGTITGSIGYLALSSEKWHYRLGSLFLPLLTLHLYQNRKRLLK